MDTEHTTQLLDEAALIFVQLREAPDDPALLAERDSFLARGPAARAAYQKIQDGWQISGGRPRSRTKTILSLVLVATLCWYFGAKPVLDFLIADISTGVNSAQATLKSGDIAVLDADTALVDDTQDGARAVRLLRGAAVFDVETNARPFIVTLGDATITVRGTMFETAYLADILSVSVAEGSVDVTIDGQSWTLSAGERLDWGQSGATIQPIAPDDVAPWRGQQLVVTDMPVAHIARILDRRLRGDLVVLAKDLAQERVSGRFDLTNPESALSALAAITGAQFYSGAPLASALVRTE